MHVFMMIFLSGRKPSSLLIFFASCSVSYIGELATYLFKNSKFTYRKYSTELYNPYYPKKYFYLSDVSMFCYLTKFESIQDTMLRSVLESDKERIHKSPVLLG